MRLPIDRRAIPAIASFATRRATALVLAVTVWGCGGTVAPLPGGGDGDGTTHDGGAPPSSADDAGVHLLSDNPSCPRAIPPLPTGPTSPGGAAIGGTSCSGVASCEYGTNAANPACNTILECVTRRGSCNSVDDCAQSDADRVWSTAYSPYGADPVRCQEALTLQAAPSRSDCPKVRPAIGEACNTNDAECVYSTCNWADVCSRTDCFIVVARCEYGFWGAGNANPPCGQAPQN